MWDTMEAGHFRVSDEDGAWGKEDGSLIEVRGLTKYYGDILAIDHLDFTVERGRIYGFLGPNGAGKTTTMNIMTGCLAATEGTVVIDGHDIFEDPKEAKRQIGYLPEQPPLYLEMTPAEYLTFVAEAKGVPRAKRAAEVERVLERCSLEGMKDRLMRNLSKGYRQRVGLAQALIGDPPVVILDEPTVGLDPKQIIEIRDLIRSLGEKHTVILSSHILSEIRAVCDHILIISHGRLVASDTPEALMRRSQGMDHLRLTLRGDRARVEKALAAIAGVETVTFGEPEEAGALAVSLECSTDCREAVFFALAEIRTPILAMARERVNLEAVFLELTDDEQPPAGADTGGEDDEDERAEEPPTLDVDAMMQAKEAADDDSDL